MEGIVIDIWYKSNFGGFIGSQNGTKNKILLGVGGLMDESMNTVFLE